LFKLKRLSWEKD